ncbi:MAG: hypothetical protein ABWJ42_06535 [Sulfolobales archaeon]
MFILKILSFKDISIPHTIEIIKKNIESREANELLYRVLEYGEEVAKCDFEAAEEIARILSEKGLKDVTITQIIDIAPRTVDELRILFYFEERIPDREFLEEIINLLNEKCSSQ